MNLWILMALKTAVPLAGGLIVVAFLRRRSAALRHAVLVSAMFATMAVPWLQPLAPAWSVNVGSLFTEAPAAAPDAVVREAPIASQPVSPVADAAVPATPHSTRLSLFALLAALWIAGAAAGCGALVVGGLRLRRINANCREMAHAGWQSTADAIARRYRIGRISLRESRSAPLLVAFGWRRPAVLVPQGAEAWPEARVRMVLAHELAHIQRGDWMTQIVAEVMRAVLWFNPLAWIVARRLRDESERACDDLVLDTGVDAADYAETLAALARTLQEAHNRWVPAPAMARPSSLEGRVRAMLDTTMNRTRPRRRTRIFVWPGLLAVTIAIAGYGAAAQSFSTVSGEVRDAFGGHVGGVTLSLENQASSQRYEIKSGVNGHFEFVGVVGGEYRLETGIPGFKPTSTRLTIAARNVTQNVTLAVGDLEETISVTSDRGTADDAGRAVDKLRELRARQRALESPVAREEANAACVPTATGGAIKAPTKVADKRPVYPAAVMVPESGQRVEFDATIAADGTVREAKPVDPSANPELVSAGADAIRQWRYTPTLLNCIPIEVSMRVRVLFK